METIDDANRTCATWRYYKQLIGWVGKLGSMKKVASNYEGYCLRYPPVASQPNALPLTRAESFCGEWRFKPNPQKEKQT